MAILVLVLVDNAVSFLSHLHVASMYVVLRSVVRKKQYLKILFMLRIRTMQYE